MPFPSPFQIALIGGWALSLGTVAFALRKGGPAERIGAIIIIVVIAASFVIEASLNDPARGVAHLANDALMAMAFLAVAIRYGNLWLGGAMLLQAAQFSLHAFYYVMDRPRDAPFAIINNLDTLGIHACIIAGTIVAMRQAAARRKAAPPAA